MATLTAKQRKAVPASAFGLPDTRQYPVEDKPHAANAKARAKQQLDKGALSRAQFERIAARANAELKK